MLDLAQTFGVDRNADIRLVNGENAVVEVRETDQETNAQGGGRRITVLHCWGAGSGADQLYKRIEDPDLVAELGIIEDDFEDTSITDLATLEARGLEEFNRRKNPFTEAEAETTLDVLGDAWLQDKVTVVDPASGTVAALEIREIQVAEDRGGEIVRLGLGTEIVSLVDMVVAGRAKPSGLRPHVPPLQAPSLRAEGMYEAIHLTWTLVPGAESYDLEHSTDGSAFALLASDVPALSYDHRGLVLGSAHWYKVYPKRGGARGPASNVVRQTAKDVTAPAQPTASASGIIRGIAIKRTGPTPPTDYATSEYRVTHLPHSRLSTFTDAGASGGSVTRANGYVWYELSQNIPFDTAKLYHIRAKVRQVSDPTSGGKAIYVGVAGVGADGVTYININGQDSFGSQHYFAASGVTPRRRRRADGVRGLLARDGHPGGRPAQ
ncbi:MAG: hypothetical protein AB1609_11615 [Bacillota bacterium]